MNDIYRELLRRSLRDTASVVEQVEREEDVDIGDIGPMALSLYQYRVMSSERTHAEAKQKNRYPDDDRRGAQ